MGQIDGHQVALGNRALFAELGIGLGDLGQRAEALRRDGQTVMFVALDGQPAGLLGVADPIKPATPEALQLLREQIAQSLPYSIDDYARILKALQLVDPKTPDLIGRMLKLYESQVLAFYDPHTHVYYAIKDLPPMLKGVGDADALQQAIAVHELTHALQDQRFHAGEREESLRRDTDAEMAYHSLVEGEASLVMMAWMLEKGGQTLDQAMKSDATMQWLTDSAVSDKTVDPSTPRYFIDSLKFPWPQSGLKRKSRRGFVSFG